MFLDQKFCSRDGIWRYEIAANQFDFFFQVLRFLLAHPGERKPCQPGHLLKVNIKKYQVSFNLRGGYTNI